MTNDGDLAFLLGICLCFSSPLVVLTAIAAWIQVLRRRPDRGLIIGSIILVQVAVVLIVIADFNGDTATSFEESELIPVIWLGWSVIFITNFLNQLYPTKKKKPSRISIRHLNYFALFVIGILLIRYYVYPLPYGLPYFELESMITMAAGVMLSIAWILVNFILPRNSESRITLAQRYSVYAIVISTIALKYCYWRIFGCESLGVRLFQYQFCANLVVRCDCESPTQKARSELIQRRQELINTRQTRLQIIRL